MTRISTISQDLLQELGLENNTNVYASFPTLRVSNKNITKQYTAKELKEIGNVFIYRKNQDKEVFKKAGEEFKGIVLKQSSQVTSKHNAKTEWYSEEFDMFATPTQPIIIRNSGEKEVSKKYSTYNEFRTATSFDSDGEVIKNYKFLTILYVYITETNEIVKIILSGMSTNSWINYKRNFTSDKALQIETVFKTIKTEQQTYCFGMRDGENLTAIQIEEAVEKAVLVKEQTMPRTYDKVATIATEIPTQRLERQEDNNNAFIVPKM